MWFLRYTSEYTNKQTHRHADRNTWHPYQKQSNDVVDVMVSG